VQTEKSSRDLCKLCAIVPASRGVRAVLLVPVVWAVKRAPSAARRTGNGIVAQVIGTLFSARLTPSKRLPEVVELRKSFYRKTEDLEDFN
jgi:hypothetical protein